MAEKLGISVSFFISLRHYHLARISGFTCDGFQANRVEYHDIDNTKKVQSHARLEYAYGLSPSGTRHHHPPSGLMSTMNLLAPDDTVRFLHLDAFFILSLFLSTILYNVHRRH